MKRRQFNRYKVSDDLFVTFRTRLGKLGKVVDVSAGGLSFEYLSEKAGREEMDSTFASVDVFSKERLFLGNFACRIVYDRTSSPQGYSIFKNLGGMEVRRCGLQFAELDTGQRDELQSFLTSPLVHAQPPELKRMGSWDGFSSTARASGRAVG